LFFICCSQERKAFEWVVRDVQRLKEFVETGPDATDTSSGDGEYSGDTGHSFDVFRDSPLLGDGKFKLEIGSGLSTL
jgi:hypothetical protein